MKKFPVLVLGGLLGGAVLFGWGMVSWMFLPFHKATLHSFTYPVAVEQALKANTSGKAVYLIPDPHSMNVEENKRIHQEMAEGPFAFVVYSPWGLRSMKRNMIYCFAAEALAAFFVTWILLQTGKKSYAGKLGVVMAFAVAAGLVVYLPNWIWWGFPAGFTLLGIADLLAGWFLAGLILAKIAKA